MEKKPKTERLPETGLKERSDRLSDPRRREVGGRKTGLEPTRYGDWEKNGRCIDF